MQPNVAEQVQSRQCSLTNAAPTMQPHATKPAPKEAKPGLPQIAKSAQQMNVDPPRTHSHDQLVMFSSILQSF